LREQQWLRYRRARDNAQGTWSPPGSQRHWIYPLQSWADFHDYKVNEYLCWLFCMVATQPSVAQAGIQVRVRKNDMAALFNIDMLRTPYFFDDRTKEKGATGKTKKIFHIVRAHRRRIGDGSTVVHTHFRGLRDFIWNGYGVHISVPGLHHVPYQEFNADTVDDSQIPKGEKIHTGAEMAQWVISESPVRAPPYKSIYNANCHLIKTRPPKIINEN